MSDQDSDQPTPEDRRAHRRIDVPMLAELRHAALQPMQCVVENVSESGAFLRVSDASVKIGSQAKVQLLNTSAIEQEPTPTIAMKVVRVTESGLGVEFANKSARHLWRSAERRRRQLTIGEDYFQVHVNLVVMAGARMLLLMNRGRWVLPNFYLRVGENWRDKAADHLLSDLGLTQPVAAGIVTVENQQLAQVPETATLSIYQRTNVAATQIEISRTSDYSDHRWISQVRNLRELTIASEHTQQLLEQLLTDQSLATAR
ncbi:MAG: PilZ domain-containing protein [Pseudomonadales bacterium]